MPYPPTDGESLVIMNDVRVLKRLGHTVFLFCLNTEKHWVDTAGYSQNLAWDGFMCVNYFPDSLKSYSRSLFSSRPLQLARFYSSDTEIRMKDYLVHRGIDLIIYQGLAMTQYLKDEVVKKLYRVHNLESRIWYNLAKNSRYPHKKFLYSHIAASLEKYETLHLSCMSAIVALSHEEKSIFENYYSDRTLATIAISLPLAPLKTYKEERQGILFMGSLDWLPNREGLNWFLQKVYPAIKHIPLTLAGKGQFICNLENVRVIPNFEHKEDLLNTHKCMIVPLLSGAGIRIKIIEAMQFGLPIISTSIGSEGIESIADSIIIENNSDKWIRLIQELYCDDSMRIILSENLVTSYQAYYSEEQVAKKWENLMSKL